MANSAMFYFKQSRSVEGTRPYHAGLGMAAMLSLHYESENRHEAVNDITVPL